MPSPLPAAVAKEAASFLDAIDAVPDDATRLGAFADWLDDRGTQPALAYAYRWMMRRGFRPHCREQYFNRLGAGRRVPAKHRWGWYRDLHLSSHEIKFQRVPAHAILPRAVMKFGPGQRFYELHFSAVWELSNWLESIRLGYSLDVPEVSAKGGAA